MDENILSDFAAYTEKSAAVMLGHQAAGSPDTNLTGGGQPPVRHIDVPEAIAPPAPPAPATALKKPKF